ncbi:response regulator, partial [Rhizobium ruizarguesonis]
DGAYDAVLLDRQLPDGDGLELIPNIRKKGLTLPIIVIDARSSGSASKAGLLPRSKGSYLSSCAALLDQSHWMVPAADAINRS